MQIENSKWRIWSFLVLNIEEGEEKCRNPQHTSLIHVFQNTKDHAL